MKNQRKLYEIAFEIRRDWDEKISHHARPYLDAMFDLSDIHDKYFYDSGASIVGYFLANARSWKGEIARNIKKELNTMLTKYYKS